MWRAATVRLDTRLPINQTEEGHAPRDAYDYRGRILTYGETLFVVARTGFRPAQTRRLLVGSAAAYAALTALFIAQALVQAFLPPPPSELTAGQWPRGEGGLKEGVAWGHGGRRGREGVAPRRRRPPNCCLARQWPAWAGRPRCRCGGTRRDPRQRDEGGGRDEGCGCPTPWPGYAQAPGVRCVWCLWCLGGAARCGRAGGSNLFVLCLSHTHNQCYRVS